VEKSLHLSYRQAPESCGFVLISNHKLVLEFTCCSEVDLLQQKAHPADPFSLDYCADSSNDSGVMMAQQWWVDPFLVLGSCAAVIVAVWKVH